MTLLHSKVRFIKDIGLQPGATASSLGSSASSLGSGFRV